MLLSLLLMSTLLGAAWSLMGIFQNRLERSQQQTEQWQLIRSLQQSLERDVTACVIPRKRRPVQTESSESNVGSGSRNVTGRESTSAGASIFNDESPIEEANAAMDTDEWMTDEWVTAEGSDPLGRFQMSPEDLTKSLDRLAETEWLTPGICLIGNTQGLVVDSIPPAVPGDRRVPEHEAPLDRAELPDIRRRIVYLFSDPRTAVLKDRPPGLIRCELTMRQLSTLRHLGTGQQDLIALLKPFIPNGAGGDESMASTDHSAAVRETAGQLRLRTSVATDSSDFNLSSVADSDPVQRIGERRLDPKIRDQHQSLGLGGDLDYLPEIALLMFRYYDGTTWLPAWDTRQKRRLPRAIEVRFQLRSEIERFKTPDAESTSDEFLTVDRASHDADRSISPLLASESNSLDPVDDRTRSSITQPPQDHRFSDSFVRCRTYLGGNTAADASQC